MRDTIAISVAEAKAKLSEKIRVCRSLDRTFVITSHGRPKAVLISYEAYLSMAEGGMTSRTLDTKRWKEQRASRREVAHEIKELFDEKRLSRKGQKGYKRRAVKRMEKG